jgi:hypothetical protein
MERKHKEIPWRDNSSFVTTFYAILTAMIGAILALAIGDKEIAAYWYWPIGLLALSMVSFIWGLEKFGEAVDEDDVDKYLAWLLPYNLGSSAMFYGIAMYIALHYHTGWVLLIVILFLATLASLKWLVDVWFLLFRSESEYEVYREELLGDRRPEKQRDAIMRLHQLFRRFHKRNGKESLLPDTAAFTRLQPSPIHGVGVFAIREIPQGTNIFRDDQSEMVWIEVKRVLRKSENVKGLYRDFCVLENGKYGCPSGFNNLTVSWYINEPLKGQEPNVVSKGDYDFFAARDICIGEELTVDYSTYSD